MLAMQPGNEAHCWAWQQCVRSLQQQGPKGKSF
jgi:hypothetical protein